MSSLRRPTVAGDPAQKTPGDLTESVPAQTITGVQPHVDCASVALTDAILTEISFDDSGLVPCVVQDYRSGEVLTVAYMNAESLKLTIETGETVFWSRSRRELWHKGATSGNTQTVKALRYDCYGRSIVAQVLPHGPACHTDNRSCFHRGEPGPESLEHGPAQRLAPFETLPELERTIAARKADDDGGRSYTAALLREPALAGAKVREEAEEVTRAAREESVERVADEAADVLYHLTVLLATRDLTLADAFKVLDDRRGAARRYRPEEDR